MNTMRGGCCNRRARPPRREIAGNLKHATRKLAERCRSLERVVWNSSGQRSSRGMDLEVWFWRIERDGASGSNHATGTGAGAGAEMDEVAGSEERPSRVKDTVLCEGRGKRVKMADSEVFRQMQSYEEEFGNNGIRDIQSPSSFTTSVLEVE